MKVSRFVSNVAPERQRFASPLQAAGFGLIAMLALVAVFPAHSLQDRLQSSARVDAVSMAYLGAWLHAKPDDYSLRLVLARHHLQSGELADSERVLAPLLAATVVDPDMQKEAAVLLLDIRQRQLWNAGVQDSTYASVRNRYLGQLRRVAAITVDRERLRKFADIGFVMGDRTLGRDIYQRLINDEPTASFDLVERLVQVDIAAGDYRSAASRYFSMLPYADSVEKRRQYLLAGLRTLQSGNLLREAIAAGQLYGGPLANDSQTLVYLVNLALADGRTDIASSLAARLLRQRLTTGKSA
jgi:hypothetical protein